MSTTAGASDQFQGVPTLSSCQASSPKGPDQVYAFTPTVNGTLAAILAAYYDQSLVEIREACANDASDVIGCAAQTTTGSPYSTSAPVHAGTTYFVVVDTWANHSGNFTLNVQLSPPPDGG